MPLLLPSFGNRIEPLLPPQALKKQLPLNQQQEEFVADSRKAIKRILDGDDSRYLLVVGPCSIHDSMEAKEYASNLKKLADSIADTFFIVMRVHCEKPRTTVGWKGFLYDPFLDGSHDIKTGLYRTRQLLLDLASMEVPAAVEFLDPLASNYIDDLVSWGSIGARTTTSQIHRQMASGLKIPIGFKNSIDGNVDNAVQALIATKSPHVCLGIDEEGHVAAIHTEGNEHAHLVLRGGERRPNYDTISVNSALQKLEEARLPRRVLIDCSHDNSCKQPEKQPAVARSVIQQILEGNKCIIGMSLESNLLGGSQFIPTDLSKLQYGVSLTDPCLDWEETRNLLLWAYAQFHEKDEMYRSESVVVETVSR